MDLLHGLPEWLAAVVEHWHGWVSGGVLGFALEAGEKLWKWEIKKRTFAIILAIGLLWSVFATWRDEHRNLEILVDGKASVWSQYNQCDKERAVKSQLADTFSSGLAVQQAQISGQQETFNRCILALGDKNAPEPLKTEVFRWLVPVPLKSGTNVDSQLWVLFALTNKPVSPVRGAITCDAPFTPLTANILNHRTTMGFGMSQESPQSVHVEFVTPPWSVKNPIVLAVATPVGKEVNQCVFKFD